MNKKIFVATINWIKTNETGKIIVPLNNPTYSPQISVEGEYVFQKVLHNYLLRILFCVEQKNLINCKKM